MFLKPLYTANSHILRRKACLVTYKTMFMYKECIQDLSDLLCDCLKDKESSVQIASVTTILEISRINPRIFLPVLPVLYDLLSTKSNWLLIKILKTVILLTPRSTVSSSSSQESKRRSRSCTTNC